MHTILSYHGNRPTPTQTDRTDYNTLRRSFASMQCNYRIRVKLQYCMSIEQASLCRVAICLAAVHTFTENNNKEAGRCAVKMLD